MNPAIRVVLVAAGLLAVALLFVMRDPALVKRNLFAQAMPSNYFSAFDRIAPALYPVEGPVWAYEHHFSRSLVIRTDEGIAVFDTFDKAHAEGLKAALAETFPGETVRWVVFSHNHLDHIRGSDTFEGAAVIGHADINGLVDDWHDAGPDIAPVTQPIAGDTLLRFGDVEVEALYMPLSHSTTLYGFHVKGADVVFAADMMFVKAIPPFDFPDFYYPGYIRALDRLIALDAKHYVPSHMDRGSRADLVAYRDMTVDFQATIRAMQLENGIENAVHEPNMSAVLRASYNTLHAKYGDWHGFDDMFVPKFGRHYGGTYLGY